MGRKRGNGEGTIYQAPDGKWMAQATIRSRRKSLYGKTRKEVADKLRALLADLDKGVLPPPERLTVAQFMERWLEDSKRRSVKPRAYEHYRQMTGYYIVPNLGRVKLSRLQPVHLQGLYSQLLERGLSERTVHHVHAVLRNALGQALKWGNVPRNVADLVDAPRAKRTEVEYLDQTQAATLLASVKGNRWEPLIVLAVATGMRQSELLGLQWADLDLLAGRLQVRRQLDRDGSMTEPKTAKGRRTIALPSNVSAMLRDHRARQNATRLLMGPQWEHNDLVFCTHSGRPLGHRNVLRAFSLLLGCAGLPHVSFHALRHTHATMLLQEGVAPKIVQERLGHSNIGMTMDIYSHFIPGMDAEAAGKLDSMFA